MTYCTVTEQIRQIVRAPVSSIRSLCATDSLEFINFNTEPHCNLVFKYNSYIKECMLPLMHDFRKD